MKVMAIVHGYPTTHNAGAEWMLHEMLKYLVEQGHEADVVVKDVTPHRFEGVNIVNKSSVRAADIIISHLKRSGLALNICEYYKKPYVELVHNSNTMGVISAKDRAKGAGRFVYVVYNSEFTKKENKYPNPSIVVHPFVDEHRYKTKPGKKITLINLFERKGGKFFTELAELMPDYEFLGVEGCYGEQVKKNLKNIEYMANTPDAKKIYAKTRILLMPSLYESYGRTGIEAFTSGIPVIAAPTPGLKESLDGAGIFCSLDSPLKWVEAIRSLEDETVYKAQSKKCVDRAKAVDKAVKKEMEDMNTFFHQIVEKQI